jgi:hypothetical protein
MQWAAVKRLRRMRSRRWRGAELGISLERAESNSLHALLQNFQLQLRE